ncbi:DUF7373 family lipoprotein [Nocardia huaxiensis]|uniref:DUF7373 family lipoprotein n=1 Tax=Nocardia huaxiensis TaxID=2755382 RepID=UPI001E4EBA42|nr:hypothetical protein [Nocardia huaxiensis]UFS95476.1 hypothetical protein LPY97_33175 [Nocardia huaxiensis]
MRHTTGVLAALSTAALLVITGCGSSEPESPAAAPVIDVSTLDVGGYSTQPREIQKTVFDRARFTEGQRLSSVIPLPMEIDPRFTIQSDPMSSYQVFAFLAVGNGMGGSTKDIDSEGTGFIAGFRSSAHTDPDIGIATTMTNSVMLFQDEKSATEAAKTFADARLSQKTDGQRVSIDKYPAAIAQWTPGKPDLEAFIASGRYVIYSYVKDFAKDKLKTTDLPAMQNLIAKSIETIQPRLSAFQPTPYDQLGDIALDHDGMLGRTLQKPQEEKKLDAAGLYDATGALHLSTDPAHDKELFTEAGVDWVAKYAGLVYRAKDSESAQRIFADRSVIPRIYRRADSPQNLPGSACREYRGDSSLTSRFHCVVTYDRYAAEVWSGQLVDAQQRISAQYAMLANAR